MEHYGDWGRNSDGAFGNNDVVAHSSPVQVGAGTETSICQVL